MYIASHLNSIAQEYVECQQPIHFSRLTDLSDGRKAIVQSVIFIEDDRTYTSRQTARSSNTSCIRSLVSNVVSTFMRQRVLGMISGEDFKKHDPGNICSTRALYRVSEFGLKLYGVGYAEQRLINA